MFAGVQRATYLVWQSSVPPTTDQRPDWQDEQLKTSQNGGAPPIFAAVLLDYTA